MVLFGLFNCSKLWCKKDYSLLLPPLGKGFQTPARGHISHGLRLWFQILCCIWLTKAWILLLCWSDGGFSPLKHFPLCFDLLRAITTRESRRRRVFLLRIPSKAEKCQRGLLAAFKWLNLVLFKESLGTPAIRTFKTRHTDGRVHSFQMLQKLQVTVFPANIIHAFVSFVASCY